MWDKSPNPKIRQKRDSRSEMKRKGGPGKSLVQTVRESLTSVIVAVVASALLAVYRFLDHVLKYVGIPTNRRRDKQFTSATSGRWGGIGATTRGRRT